MSLCSINTQQPLSQKEVRTELSEPASDTWWSPGLAKAILSSSYIDEVLEWSPRCPSRYEQAQSFHRTPVREFVREVYQIAPELANEWLPLMQITTFIIQNNQVSIEICYSPEAY